MIYTLPTPSEVLAKLIAEGLMPDPMPVMVETRDDGVLEVKVGPWSARWDIATGTFQSSGSEVVPA